MLVFTDSSHSRSRQEPVDHSGESWYRGGKFLCMNIGHMWVGSVYAMQGVNYPMHGVNYPLKVVISPPRTLLIALTSLVDGKLGQLR